MQIFLNVLNLDSTWAVFKPAHHYLILGDGSVLLIVTQTWNVFVCAFLNNTYICIITVDRRIPLLVPFQQKHTVGTMLYQHHDVWYNVARMLRVCWVIPLYCMCDIHWYTNPWSRDEGSSTLSLYICTHHIFLIHWWISFASCM